jgi:Ca2+-binding RTX toxin-like protein
MRIAEPFPASSAFLDLGKDGACNQLCLPGRGSGSTSVWRSWNVELRGAGGNDRIRGGTGNDRIRGGPGKDTCKGGPGNDKIKGCEN